MHALHRRIEISRCRTAMVPTAVLTLFALAACGGNDDSKPPSRRAETAVSAPKPLVLRTDVDYRVINACGNKLLSVNEGAAFSGAALFVNTDAQKPSQRWRLEAASDGDYVLRAVHASELTLDVQWSDPSEGNLVHAWQANGGNAQRWQIVPGAALGTVQMRTRVDLTKALDVRWAVADDGAAVQISSLNDSCAQQWRLEADGGAPPAPAPGDGRWVFATSEWGSFDLAATARVRYGMGEAWIVRDAVPAGTVPCTNANFGDPAFGVVKRCEVWEVGTAPPPSPLPPPAPPISQLYQDNLRKIRASTVRNTNLDNSKYLTTPMAAITVSDLLGPREDYIRGDDGVVPGLPGGNSEEGFPTRGVGTFRTSCEFSHFAYDDPLVHPNKPGAAHLHMFWGNTDVNAYSTYDTLVNSGSGTCNGAELNRTGYWAPAMFDAKGNVRIPERIIVYYKGYGLANGASQVYPPRAAMVINDRVHRTEAGGAPGEPNFLCSDQFRGNRHNPSPTIPNCTDGPWRRTLEMHVKFGNCWNRNDPSKPENWELPKQGSWYYSDCQDSVTTPNIHYIIAYPLEPGENTNGWYLASDVSPLTFQRSAVGGSSIHADWWGGWHPDINKQFVDNCVNFKKEGADHGCGFGYLTDGGPDGLKPYPGPALKYRQQYTGPTKVPAQTIFNQLCEAGTRIGSAERAAFCKPTEMQLAAALKGSLCTAHDPLGTGVATPAAPPKLSAALDSRRSKGAAN